MSTIYSKMFYNTGLIWAYWQHDVYLSEPRDVSQNNLTGILELGEQGHPGRQNCVQTSCSLTAQLLFFILLLHCCVKSIKIKLRASVVIRLPLHHLRGMAALVSTNLLHLSLVNKCTHRSSEAGADLWFISNSLKHFRTLYFTCKPASQQKAHPVKWIFHKRFAS